MKQKEPLYRKVNTKARNNHHHTGEDAKYSRNTKTGIPTKMKQGIQRGLDYTPLFRFLLSKVGKKWDEVYSEARGRVDKIEPIKWMVDIFPNEIDTRDHFRTENSIWSKLIVDEDGILKLKNPELKNEDFTPSCHCCMNSFNGKPLNKKFHF